MKILWVNPIAMYHEYDSEACVLPIRANFSAVDSLVFLTFRALAVRCDHTFRAIMEKFT